MAKLVQCVPNISEGRELAVIEGIILALKEVDGVKILETSSDEDHNRTVLTFVAELETAVKAMFCVIENASQLIDMNSHKGGHPRIGAVDVAPFIPLGETTIEECMTLATELAQKVAKELEIPVYMYGYSALSKARENLSNIRRGEFEYLRDNLGSDKARTPDYGPNHIHPTFGAVAIGVRQQIVNFNININTADIKYGEFLAKKLRGSNGGLTGVKVKEVFLKSKGIVQISTVISDYKTTSILKVLNAVKKDLAVHGLKVLSTELVGLTTEKAINDYVKESLKLAAFEEEKLLERKIEKELYPWQKTIKPLISAITNPRYMPGGGSVGALSAITGVSLGAKAIKISMGSKKTIQAQKEKLKEALEVFKDMLDILEHLAIADTEAYDKYVSLYKLPKDDPKRKNELEQAMNDSLDIPTEIAEVANSALIMLDTVKSEITPSIEADFAGAKHILRAALNCELAIINSNMKLVSAEKREEIKVRTEPLLADKQETAA